MKRTGQWPGHEARRVRKYRRAAGPTMTDHRGRTLTCSRPTPLSWINPLWFDKRVPQRFVHRITMFSEVALSIMASNGHSYSSCLGSTEPVRI